MGSQAKYELKGINTFAAIVDLSRFNNSCLRLLKISDDNNDSSDRPQLADTTNPTTHGDWRLYVQN
jgi:hypothetical protein